MKKIFFTLSLVLGVVLVLVAQDCATSKCPAQITVHHVAGPISPATVSITYGVKNVTSPKLCWITQNLGATAKATAYTDTNKQTKGWFWQFNRKQGFSAVDFVKPPTTWITSIPNEDSDWLTENDPCSLLLGGAWRLPTYTEWVNTKNSNSISAATVAYTFLSLSVVGSIAQTGDIIPATASYYCSSTQFSVTNSWNFIVASAVVALSNYAKETGNPVRCVMPNPQ